MSCWNTIGVWGNEQPRCPRLAQEVHCRNCDVFASAGRAVLERLHSPETLLENARRLAEPVSDRRALSASWLVFRLAEEWMALPTRCFEEVIAPRPIHSIPHRTVLGLANFRGRLELCCSLEQQLGVAPARDQAPPRCIVVLAAPSGRLILAPVAEVLGTYRFPEDEVQQGSSRALVYLSGIVHLESRRVGLLDPELLFEALERNFRR